MTEVLHIVSAKTRSYTVDMFPAHRAPQLILRIGLAAVFLWYGIGAFMQPQYWIDSWMPLSLQSLAERIAMGPVNFVILIGILEVLVAASLATGFFIRWFAVTGALFLTVVLVSNGFSEELLPDIGLIAGLTALAVWPERSYS